MRVFLDANVLFSATFSDGAIHRLLTDLQRNDITCVVDSHVTNEARRNLVVHRPDRQHRLDGILSTCERNEMSFSMDLNVVLPEKDRPVLSAAIGYRCSYLITGDKTHFGALFGRSIKGTRIVTPRMAADQLLGSNPSLE